MNKLIYRMPCLSESRNISSKMIYENFFDKKVRNGHIEKYIQKFLVMNRDVFDFLGVEVCVNGSGNNLSMNFVSSKYIGAIPVRMPYDGIAHKDLQIFPKFGDGNEDVFSVMTNILNELDFVVEPEYKNDSFLSLSYQLRPPLYNEAVEYVRLFEDVIRYKWGEV